MQTKTNDDGSVVQLSDLQIEMRVVLVAADKIWKRHGQELVVTCTGGSVHSAGSLHPYGYAIDLRTNYFGVTQIDIIAAELRAALPPGYQVVVHKSHIHVEYDAILRG